MKTTHKFLLIAFCSLFTFVSYAQVTNQPNSNFINNQVPVVKECGTEATPQQILHMTQTRQDRQDWEQPETFITIPVQHHVVRNTNGTGGLSQSAISGIMQNLNDYYTNGSMQFYECNAINFINSTTNYNFDASNENSFCGANDVPNVLNIYYFNSVTSNGNSLCGYSRFPPSVDRAIMKNSCATNGSTIVHEIGHYFSLYHSHGKTNCGTTDELVNGSNCSTHGDDVCDTPADPNLQLSSTSNTACGSTTWVNNTTSCSYTGTFTDANGASYSPDPTNIMSYSLKDCRTNLSTGQYNRANYSAINDRNNLSCSSSNPDLYIGNGSFWNGFVVGGSTGTAPITINNNWIIYNQIQVVNDASGSGTIPSELGFYLSTNPTISTADYFLGWNPVPSISPGDTSIQSAVFDIGSSYYNSIPNGTYYIGAYADYTNVVVETTGLNNGEAFEYSNGMINPVTGAVIWDYYQITITRGCTDSLATNYNASANIDDGSCTYPDLEITNEHYTITFCFPPPCSTTPPVSVSGSVIDFNVDVANNGDGSASPTQLGYYLSLNTSIVPNAIDHLLGTDQVDGGSGTIFGIPITFLLAAGATSNETATFDLSDPSYNGIPDGTYYIGAYADYDETLHESNENNNDAAFNWTNIIFITQPSGAYQITIERGCTNPVAVNYSPSANIDDGSCTPCTVAPYFENFDAGTGTTINNGWIRNSGSTPTGNAYATGPNDDMTGGGSYMYYETSTGYLDTVTISTECLDISGLSNPCLDFAYHMYGTSIGTLDVEVNGTNVFTMSGDQGNQWNLAQVSLSAFVGNDIEVTFIATYGGGYIGDMAIDDISVNECATYGCTDPFASNYNPLATVDDGSCIPCTDNQITIIINTGNDGWQMDWNLTNSSGVVVASNCCVLNYPSNIDSMEVVELCLPDDCYTMNMFDLFSGGSITSGYGWDGGTYEIWQTGPVSSVVIASGTALNMGGVSGPAGSDTIGIGVACPVYGCTDPLACNYNPLATINDSSCTGLSGCMDPFASNYNPFATCDDSSCIPCLDNQVTIIINTGNYAYEMDWNLTNSLGDTVASNCCVGNYLNYTDSMDVQYLCLPDDCYSMNMWDGYGDGWNGGTYEVWTNGNATSAIASGTALNMGGFGNGGPAGNDLIQIGTTVVCPILGCTDPNAPNYNPNANQDDGSCLAPMVNLFISEHAEGSSNNKYFEVYNPSNDTINLDDYAFARVVNAPSTVGIYEYWINFTSGAVVLPNDVYVVAHPSSDASILAETDKNKILFIDDFF